MPRRPHDPATAVGQPATANAAAALLDRGGVARLRRLQKAVCEPTRAQIVRALGVEPLSVQELAQLLGRPQPATSQHLRVLRQVGVVDVERHGRRSHYHLSTGPVAAAAAGLLAVCAVGA